MAKQSSFKYRGKERTVEDAARRSRQAGGGYDSYLAPDIPMLKVREGESQLRVMPPTWEDMDKWGNDWALQIYVHFGIGADEATYLCLDKMKGEPCPICEARRESTDDKERDAFRPSWRGLAWTVDRNDMKAGPQVWSMSATLFKEINARSIDKKNGGLILIDDPEDGYDVTLIRTGTDMRTKYSGIEVEREPSPIHDNEKKQDAWMEYIQDNPLPDVLQFYDAEYIEKVLSGQSSSRRNDDDEDGGGRKRRGRRDEQGEEEEDRRGRRRRAAAEDEDDEKPRPRRASADEDEDDEKPKRRRRSADEEEEERPSRRRRAEPEEEEEEEAPRRRARASEEREGEETSSRRRRAAEDDGSGDEAPSHRRRAAAKDEDDEKPTTTRRRGKLAEEDDEKPKRRAAVEDEDDEKPKSRRRASKDEDDEIPFDGPGGGKAKPRQDDPTAQARQQLSKLKARASKWED